MAADPKAAALALHRFGLGPRPGSIGRIAGDPRGARLAELRRPNADGFADDSANWMDGLPQRLDIAGQFANHTADKLEPIKLIDAALGPLASNVTRQTISFAGSRQQALTLLLLAPEFQRR